MVTTRTVPCPRCERGTGSVVDSPSLVEKRREPVKRVAVCDNDCYLEIPERQSGHDSSPEYFRGDLGTRLVALIRRILGRPLIGMCGRSAGVAEPKLDGGVV